MFAKTFGCVRFVYNRMLADKIKHYEETKQKLNNTPAQYKKEFDWLKEVDSLALAFRPSEKITRAEFVTLVVNLYNAHHLGAKMITSAHDFTDLSQDHWAWNFIQQGVDYQWLSGYEDSTFRPDNNIIRAEAIVILNRMLGRGNCEHLDGLKNPWIDLQPTHKF